MTGDNCIVLKRGQIVATFVVCACSSEGYIYYTATVLREKFLIEHFQTFSSVKGKILILVKVFE